ncbi:hypothetical protein SLS56_003641 [Neofusicoccum ribis]|uniref:Arca-like protein n=1 Tax=Neofusicoccum ribis TaxID=45134 RepID=A0ABR3SYI0_9PEZI
MTLLRRQAKTLRIQTDMKRTEEPYRLSIIGPKKIIRIHHEKHHRIAIPAIIIRPQESTAHLSPGWFPVETPQGGGTISELQAPSSHTLDELPEISAVGSLPGEYLDVCEWPAVPSYDHDRSVTAELPIDDADYLDPISPINSSGLWPLNRDEAMLLQYFITELSPWFDFCDKDRHFGTTVVQLSSTCEPLLNAILAVSAKHLSLTSEYCPLASDKYQRKCLQILIPALNDQDSLLDPTLFAATAILRLFDEMTDPVGDRRSRGHILGTHILLRAQETPSPTSSLRAASLLVALRQEIFISFFTRTAVQPLADYLPISRSSSTSPDDSDYAWAVRAIALAADALTFCHGQAGKSVEGWQALRARLDAWQRGKPPSFAPVRHEPRKPFPRICFANDCHGGDRFSGREEQEQLLCILKRSEAHITWPHLRAHEQLSKHWKL